MGPRVFVTGGAGYVGGQTLGTLIKAHPEYDVVVLVRNVEQVVVLQKTWPKLTTVTGTLDDADVLAREGAKADVVLRT